MLSCISFKCPVQDAGGNRKKWKRPSITPRFLLIKWKSLRWNFGIREGDTKALPVGQLNHTRGLRLRCPLLPDGSENTCHLSLLWGVQMGPFPSTETTGFVNWRFNVQNSSVRWVLWQTGTGRGVSTSPVTVWEVLRHGYPYTGPFLVLMALL